MPLFPCFFVFEHRISTPWFLFGAPHVQTRLHTPQEGSQRIGMAVAYAILLLGVIILAFTSSRIDPVDRTIYEHLQQTPREVCMHVCVCVYVSMCIHICIY
jgi:hypothetical protein